MNMVERVARIISPNSWLAISPEDNYPAERNRRQQGKLHSLAIARAAIEAMKNSSNKMDIAGCLYLRENHSDSSGCFETMIDAALEESA